MENYTILDLYSLYQKKEVSPVEVVELYLQKIEAENPKLFCYLFTTPELALEQARLSEKRWACENPLSFLDGIPLSIKDNILIKGVRCTAGSKMLENYVASYDATVISKLKKAGAVFLGKTNLDEFAMGSSTENSAFGPTRNPLDPERVPGGSSGGSAAAVSANLCVASLGSDTGGSIRLPAAFCGVVGLKPTYGSVSRYGLIAMASSLDQIGPITKTVSDARILFEVISGKDTRDFSQVLPEEMPEEKEKIVIGVPKEYFLSEMEEEVIGAIQDFLELMTEKGYEFQEISLPSLPLSLPVYYVIVASEISSNLARYDDLRYGKKKVKVERDFWEYYFQSRGEFLGKEVKRRIMLGTFVLSTGYYEAYYKKAVLLRENIREDFLRAFKKVDLILAPVSPSLPFKLGEKITDPVKMYLSDIFTVSVNLAGLPALSIPIAFPKGLPVGIQFIAPPFKEATLFKIGEKVEAFLSQR